MKHAIIYERSDLFDVNMVITMKAELSVAPSAKDVKEAFANAVGVNEILLSKIVIEKDGRAFYVDNDMPKSSICVVSEDLDRIRKREEKIRFRVEDGEYIRAFLKETPNGAEVLFLMHHMAGDGKSLLYFVEDFMTFLSGKSRSFKGIRTAQTKENLDFISRGIIKSYNKRWKEKLFTFEDMDRAYEAYWKDKTTEIDVRILEKEEMERILEECQKAGVKFTSYLTAALIKDGHAGVDVGYASDYRHDGNRSMGNQASGFSIRYRYHPAKTIFENAKKIQKKLDRKQKDQKKGSYILSFVAGIKPTLYDAVNLEHVGTFHSPVSYSLAKLMGYMGKTKDYSITNLTMADIPVKYGNYEITQLMFAGPVVSYGKCIISAVTCNGKTVITRHVRK